MSLCIHACMLWTCIDRIKVQESDRNDTLMCMNVCIYDLYVCVLMHVCIVHVYMCMKGLFDLHVLYAVVACSVCVCVCAYACMYMYVYMFWQLH
jgi:hypothetical protein